MTYARSRLWLGITAIGTLHVLAILLLLTGFHLEVPHDFVLSLRLRSIHGFWNVARTTLFLSWACGGFLARAVHCNIGRPELWVLFPTD